MPLHHALAIPPIKFTLDKLRLMFQKRLSTLPSFHKLPTLPSRDPSASRIYNIHNILCQSPPANHMSIPIYPIPHPYHFVASFLLYQGQDLLETGF